MVWEKYSIYEKGIAISWDLRVISAGLKVGDLVVFCYIL